MLTVHDLIPQIQDFDLSEINDLNLQSLVIVQAGFWSSKSQFCNYKTQLNE